MGKFILLIILYFSIISIAVLFTQMQKLNLINQQVEQFTDLLKKATNLHELYKSLQPSAFLNPVGIIFKNMIIANENFKNKPKDEFYVEYLKSDMQRSFLQIDNMISKYSSLLPFFASISPFLGLIGTIFGIIHTFHNISLTGNASISAISPGMSEALMSTAISIIVSLICASVNIFLNNKRNNIFNNLESLSGMILGQVILQNNESKNELQPLNDNEDSDASDETEYEDEV